MLKDEERPGCRREERSRQLFLEFEDRHLGDHLQLIGDKTTSGLVELGKITKVYGDDYASTKPSVLEKIAERERLKAMLADTFEAEEAPPDLPPTPPGDDQA